MPLQHEWLGCNELDFALRFRLNRVLYIICFAMVWGWTIPNELTVVLSWEESVETLGYETYVVLGLRRFYVLLALAKFYLIAIRLPEKQYLNVQLLMIGPQFPPDIFSWEGPYSLQQWVKVSLSFLCCFVKYFVSATKRNSWWSSDSQ